MTTELAVHDGAPIARGYGVDSLPVAAVKAQVEKVHELVRAVMKDDVHFGKIPGAGDRKVLLKPGAELLNMTLRLRADYEIVREVLDAEHVHYTIRCKLVHIPTESFVASGVASCSSWESKYRYRRGERKCPKCSAAAIIPGKAEYGGGWICFAKKGGCGAKFDKGAKEIESQETGKVLNPDPHDQGNTILKMAQKRALVAATLNATACSDTFTQDIEDEEAAAVVEEVRPITAEQLGVLQGLVAEAKVETKELEEVLGRGYGVRRLPDLSSPAAAHLTERLRKKIAADKKAPPAEKKPEPEKAPEQAAPKTDAPAAPEPKQQPASNGAAPASAPAQSGPVPGPARPRAGSPQFGGGR